MFYRWNHEKVKKEYTKKICIHRAWNRNKRNFQKFPFFHQTKPIIPHTIVSDRIECRFSRKGNLFIVPIKTRHAQLFLQLSRAWKYFNVDIPRISSARSYRESYIKKKKTGQKQDRRLPTLYYSSLVNPTHCSKKFQTVNAERIEPQEKIKLLDQIVLT